VFSFDTATGVIKTLATAKDPDQVLQSGSTVFAAAHGEHDVLAIRDGKASAWAQGIEAVGLGADPELSMLVVVVNAHE
jgi:hypothetical protein